MKRMGLVLAMAILFVGSQAWASEVTLNFKNADIRAFIEFVAGFSGKNFWLITVLKAK